MQPYLIETFWSEEDHAYLCIAGFAGVQRGGQHPFKGDTGNAGCHVFLAASLLKYGPRVTYASGKTSQSSLITKRYKKPLI